MNGHLGEQGRCLPLAWSTVEVPCLLYSGLADAIHSLPRGKAGSGFKWFHVNSSERTGRLCCLESSCYFKTLSFLDSWKGQYLHVPHSFTPERRLFSSLPAPGLSSCRRELLASPPVPWICGPVSSHMHSASELPAGTQAPLVLLPCGCTSLGSWCLPWTKETRISTD